MASSDTYFDIVVVGAGLSGIGAGYHFKKSLPDKKFVILESRATIGGTWDLFRYPGIRSDSSMETMGYSFKPWAGECSISPGEDILSYIHETADEYHVREHIRCSHAVKSANWNSEKKVWELQVLREGVEVEFTCFFLLLCTGYYDYDEGHSPEFKNKADFQGQIVHPQLWPQDLEYAGKNVVIVGSGATAVTLLPVLARTAKHVTMLQRSPTYITSVPARDPVVHFFRWIFPRQLAYTCARWWSVLIAVGMYWGCMAAPKFFKSLLMWDAGRHMSKPQSYMERHFSPRYDPWDQRLCLVPDGDFFYAIRDKKASVATSEIECFSKTGVVLKSEQENGSREIDADIVITATGLKLKLVGGIQVSMDGVPVDMSKTCMYKGVMVSNVPNAAVSIGYVNNTWTLKCDLTFEYVCKLVKYMEERSLKVVTPVNGDMDGTTCQDTVFNLSSGYVQRALSFLPRQGRKHPWVYHHNFLTDMKILRYSPVVDDDVLKFE